MDTLNRSNGFRQASRFTAERVLRLLTHDADAFHDETERPARLTAAERLARRSPHSTHDLHQSWCIACQRESRQELAEREERGQ